MPRPEAERIACVRRLLAAADEVYGARAAIAPAIGRDTGLSAEGVELGFASLEREASDDDLRALVAAAGDAPHVHVILSANVFVAPLRALALARAAAARVTVRPSPRDPSLARALVAAAGDGALVVVEGRDVAEGEAAAAAEVHVYGRDETIAAVRARARAGAVVRGHGAGMGVAAVTRRADVDAAADALARDVVAFDQRGCLSPRIAFVEGGDARGEAFARALHERLVAWGARVPRGALAPGEQAEAARWRDALAFAGSVFAGADHAVAFAPAPAPPAPPPAGRHVLVLAQADWGSWGARAAAIAPFVVAVGTDDRAAASPLARAAFPRGPRVLPLGAMQRPPLDGPVDPRA